MFIHAGCVSGWKADSTPITEGDMQGVAVTIRNSTTSSIKRFLPFTNKGSQLPTFGDTSRSSPSINVSSSTHYLVSASVNAYDNGPVLSTQYQVPVSFTNWADRGDVAGIGLRLGVATNENPSPTTPNQVDFQQNFNGEDSLTMIMTYYSASGDITTVGAGAKTLGFDVNQITIPYHASTAVGDTVMLFVMSEIDLATPAGFTWDYTDRINGRLSNLDPLSRNTGLTIYRRVVTPSDVSSGQVTVQSYGA